MAFSKKLLIPRAIQIFSLHFLSKVGLYNHILTESFLVKIQTNIQLLSIIGREEIDFCCIRLYASSGVIDCGAVMRKFLFIFQRRVNCSYFSKSEGVKIERGFLFSSIKITHL